MSEERIKRLKKTNNFLTVYQCPVHPHMYSLCIDNQDGGVRVMGSKCCPHMYANKLVSWHPTVAQWNDLSERFQEAGEDET